MIACMDGECDCQQAECIICNLMADNKLFSYFKS